MPIAFLAPAFLLGLAAIAVPIIVHLVQRERRDPIRFPSLMFLQRIPYRSTRRQRVRNWWLLALRCLALMLIAAAFARPFVDRRSATPAAGARAREIVLLIDRSASMRYAGRWERALAAARAEIQALGPDDRATLVAFDADARALTERVGDRATLLGALATLRPGDGATRLEPALKLAARLLERSELARREAVLVSDFPRAGWRGGGDAHLPPRSTLRTVDVSRGERADAAVVGVDVHRARAADRETATLVARVANRGPSPIARTLHLEVGGREVQRTPVRVAPGSLASVELTPIPIPDGGARVTVRLDADELPIDDAFQLVVARARELPVLLVQGPDADAGATLYVTRALSIGSDPTFRVRLRRGDAITAAELADHPLVVLLDAAPSAATAERLAAYVRGGGGILAAVGGRAGGRASASGLLPEASAIMDRLNDRGGVLGYLERTHPALELFRGPRSGDFSQARFYRYRVVRPGPADRELARFDDGATALLERRLGRGRVLVWASSLDAGWNDLPLQPVFLPFVHALARYAAAWSERPASYTVGQVVDPAALARVGADEAESGAALVATAPSGRRVRFAPADSAHRAALALEEQGFHEIRRAGTTAAPAAVIAVNIDPAEAELAHVEPQEVVRAVAGAPTARAAVAPPEELTPAERERRQSAWWYLLAGLLVLLVAEAALAQTTSMRAAGAHREVVDP